jgi:hypothetical protein
VNLFTSPKPQHVKVRLDELGKVHYATRETAQAQQQHSASYMNIPISSFANWKNAGKRSASDKVTDPTTGKSYAYRKGKFFPIDKKTVSPTAVPDNDQWWPLWKSSHHTLLNKLNSKELIDRKRGNRSNLPLQLFDVGPYEQKVGKYKALPSAGAFERDHIPAGSSLESRDAGNKNQAHAQGMTIAIHKQWHKQFSPTLGGKTQSKDIIFAKGKGAALKPKPIKRKDYDAAHPASAFARDTRSMLDSTAPLVVANPAGLQIDRTGRLTQMGAYRTLYRMNTRAHASSKARGIDPQAAAMDDASQIIPKKGKKKAKVKFTYTPGAGTQGAHIAKYFSDKLVNEQLAKR